MSGELVSGESSLPELQVSAVLPGPHMEEKESVSSPSSLPTLQISSNPDHLSDAASPNGTMLSSRASVHVGGHRHSVHNILPLPPQKSCPSNVQNAFIPSQPPQKS